MALRMMPAPPCGDGWNLAEIIWLGLAAGHAIGRLALARLHLHSLIGGEIHDFNRRAARAGRDSQAALPADEEVVRRISWLVPRVARHVPWRSDCLVQAMAAQDMLSGKGVAAFIVIGVDKPGKVDFVAHAWLHWGDTIVTGGAVSDFEVLLETP